jgi:hypothetical protein
MMNKEIEGEIVAQDQDNEWLKFTQGGLKPRPVFKGKRKSIANRLVSHRQQRGVGQTITYKGE